MPLVFLFVCVSVPLYVCLSVVTRWCPYNRVYVYMFEPLCLSVCLSVCQCLSVCVSVCVCLSVCSSVCMSVCLYVCLCVCVCSYTLVFLYYALSLVCLLLCRPIISVKLTQGGGTKSIYAALYFLPILVCIHAVLAGFICAYLHRFTYSFPAMVYGCCSVVLVLSHG